MNPWDNPKYGQIVTAHAEQGCLFVKFANGDMPTVVLRYLCPQIDASKAHDITDEHIHLNMHEIKIDYQGGTILVPWDQIRFRTDHDYAAYMVRVANKQNKNIGGIIQTMRQTKGLTLEDMVVRTNLKMHVIRGIESGDRDINFKDLRFVLGAMGFGLKDIAEVYNQENS